MQHNHWLVCMHSDPAPKSAQCNKRACIPSGMQVCINPLITTAVTAATIHEAFYQSHVTALQRETVITFSFVNTAKSND